MVYLFHMEKLPIHLSKISLITGKLISYLTILMVIGILGIVILRYVFDMGWIFIQEIIVWMHAAVFMLGAAYTYHHNEHVRVDIFFQGFSKKRQALVNLLGNVLFLIPFTLAIIYFCWDYMASSWSIREASREAGGLPYPFVPLLKSMIPLTAFLLLLESVAQAITSYIDFKEAD